MIHVLLFLLVAPFVLAAIFYLLLSPFWAVSAVRRGLTAKDPQHSRGAVIADAIQRQYYR